MKALKPAAVTAAFLLGSLLGDYAWGDSAPAVDAYARLPVCKLSEDGKRLAVEPCRTAPAAVPMPRRPVPLTIQPMPNKRLAPQVAMPNVAPSTPIETLIRPPGTPIPAVGCTAGGCYDPGGVRHNTGPAGTTITPAGKLCHRQGAWLQC